LSIEKIVDVFNTSTHFYTYDPYTALIHFAILCGCQTVIYPIDNIDAENYFKNSIYTYKDKSYTKNIIYGTSKYNYINGESNDYENMCNQYLSTVNNFLNDIINENTKLISNIY
jgi:hypothetical protein